MDELREYLTSCEFASPTSFWIGSGLLLLLVFFPLSRKRRGLRLDLGYWGRKVELRSKKVWLLSILAVITSILMALLMASPQALTKQRIRIYGKPVMLVIDISGSMAYKGMEAEELSALEKAQAVFGAMLNQGLGLDFGLLLYSTENYISRYPAPKSELLGDTLENKEEVYYIATGTRTAAALAKAHRFFSENTEAFRDRAIILVSDFKGDRDAIVETTDEMERALHAGIKIYAIVIEGAEQAATGGAPLLSRIRGVKAVGMDDENGIVQIIQELTAMESSSVREQETLLRRSLLPFLIPPALGLITLSLILSETFLRRIP